MHSRKAQWVMHELRKGISTPENKRTISEARNQGHERIVGRQKWKESDEFALQPMRDREACLKNEAFRSS